MTAALEFHAVSKTFSKHLKQIHALKDVSFSIDESEVFGFVGPNGAGKSTTIKVMLDVISDYQGDVRIQGVPARKAEARRGVAYVPESPAIYEQFTPMEVLRMALAMYGINRSDSDAWCKQWLERLSVGHVADRRMRTLSKGTVQRVALAHAMVVSPRLLILDEPLSGLDPVGRKDFIGILADYKKQGGAIFFTSHVLHDVERIADRFGFINRGQLLTVRSPRDIVTEHADRFIIRYQGNGNILSGGMQTREDEFEVECLQADLPESLAKLNMKGGKIITITPALSLENVFFKILADYTGK
jgi:ABC-2 type transport system ATP-binding protein